MKGHRWFRVHTKSIEINELKLCIKNKLQHTYVDRFVKKPFIDEDKLEILQYVYNDIQLPRQMKQQHMTSIMLVQIALDTHEKIPNQHQEWVMNETEKQLSVLAGDYYSGLYYLLLSEIEEINMIQVIATAIRKMNENKMVLFYEEVHSIDELLYLIRDIESNLFTEIASYLRTDPILISIIQDVLLINRLNRELTEPNSILANFLTKFRTELEIQENYKDEINKVILCKKDQLENKLMELPYQHIQFKNTIRAKFALSSNTSFAEEG